MKTPFKYVDKYLLNKISKIHSEKFDKFCPTRFFYFRIFMKKNPVVLIKLYQKTPDSFLIDNFIIKLSDILRVTAILHLANIL